MIPVLGVPTFTRHDLCSRMLSTIDHPIQDLIVIDNKPDNWMPVKPRLVERLHHIRIPQNLGVAGSWNLIIKSSPFAPAWLIVNDDVMFEPGALANVDYNMRPDALSFMSTSPRWAAFVLGEEVVSKVGLFSELFHPAYFEDNDYERRVAECDIEMLQLPAIAHHENSSTLKSGFDIQNHRTFKANSATFAAREAGGIMTGGEWDLLLRRDLSWD